MIDNNINNLLEENNSKMRKNKSLLFGVSEKTIFNEKIGEQKQKHKVPSWSIWFLKKFLATILLILVFEFGIFGLIVEIVPYIFGNYLIEAKEGIFSINYISVIFATVWLASFAFLVNSCFFLWLKEKLDFEYEKLDMEEILREDFLIEIKNIDLEIETFKAFSKSTDKFPVSEKELFINSLKERKQQILENYFFFKRNLKTTKSKKFFKTFL